MTELELISMRILKHPLSIIFDVGSRDETIDMIRIMPYAEYHIFEPNKQFLESNKESITSEVGFSTICHYNDFALSDISEKDVVYYANTQSIITHPFGMSTDDGYRCNTTTLDEYTRIHNITRIDFLKIDAEGADYKILLGAPNLIKKDKILAIQFEYWDGVQKFYNLLSEKYNLYYIENSEVFIELDDKVINHIDKDRIPSGLGGDILAVHKNHSL